MPDSIKTTRTGLIVASFLEIATGLLFLFIFTAGAVFIGWGTERSGLLGNVLLGATGVFLAVLFAALGVAGVFTAAGIAKGRPWSRAAAAALGVIILPAVPVGTLLGIFVLKGLLGPDARAWFGSPNGARPASYPPPAAV
jgi:hypothetical protein